MVAGTPSVIIVSPSPNQPRDDCLGLGSDSPWATLRCLQQSPVSLLTRVNDVDGGWHLFRVFGVFIFITFLVFAACSLKDIHRFILLLLAKRGDARGGVSRSEENETAAGPQNWSILAIMGLTSYRFYTGFLSATWLPYLLAMEGQDLWREKQSLFMGVAKLIYGATILMNPVFGLVGDQAVSISHGVGRRLFVRIGVTVAAIGIYICILAAEQHTFLSFLSGILVWRLGEAINDVTTEALVPEMVPQSQYGIASSIKACSFLLGGLFGYTMLILLADVNYSWLYFAYPIGMFLCAIPSLMMLDKDVPVGIGMKKQTQETFGRSLLQAYVAPTHYKGGFPRACLAVFVFSLGTAPMFFLLLVIRDLVGVTDPVELQKNFSAISIIFFLSAAASSVFAGTRVKNTSELSDATSQAQTNLESILSRGTALVVSMVVFAVVVLLIPGLSIFQLQTSRYRAFCFLAVLFGAAFGAAFSLFQDLTWQVLPPEANVANAMGFNVMSRLLGVGLGNFAAGLILDFSYTQLGAATQPGMVYRPAGYAIMCGCCFVANLTSSAIAFSAISAQRSELEHLICGKPGIPASA